MVEKAQTIKVRPIYGWGWVIDGEQRHAVPDPFDLELHCSELGRWSGVVLDEGHKFAGRKVQFSQRHLNWDGHVNIVVEASLGGNKPTAGFAVVDSRP